MGKRRPPHREDKATRNASCWLEVWADPQTGGLVTLGAGFRELQGDEDGLTGVASLEHSLNGGAVLPSDRRSRSPGIA